MSRQEPCQQARHALAEIVTILRVHLDLRLYFTSDIFAITMDELAAHRRDVRDSHFGPNTFINQGDTHVHQGTQQDADHKFERLLATLRAIDPYYDKERIEDSKGGLLVDSYRWVLDNEDFCRWRNGATSRLLWIKGDPGKGKTMLLCGIIKELEKAADSSPITYFFCQAADSESNNAPAVVKGLIYRLLKQLLKRNGALKRQFCDKYSMEIQSLQNSSSWYILCNMLSWLLGVPNVQDAYIVIDALDECSSDLQDLLRLIAQLPSSKVRVLVSSRSWPSIEHGLSQVTQKTALCLELHAEAISSAVQTYINFKVACLTASKGLDEITKDFVIKYLKSNSSNTFLWVALVCQKLEDPDLHAWHVMATVKEFPPDLDRLYARMAEQVFAGRDAELCRQVLATMLLAYRPMSLTELFSYLPSREQFPANIEWRQLLVQLCGSFLILRENTVYFVHQSAKDFLLGKMSTKIVSVGFRNEHYALALRLLEIMWATLRRNIYSLSSAGSSVGKPPDPLASARYACVYWVDHLMDMVQDGHIPHDLYDDGLVYRFLTKHLLHWLEALSLLRSIPSGIQALSKLLSALKSQNEDNTGTNHTSLASRSGGRRLQMLIHDAWRFIRYHKEGVEQAPLQVYCSGLVFSPNQSEVRQLFSKEEPKWITLKPRVENKWSECLQTLEGHGGSVNSVALSADGKLVASGSGDKTIKIWDTATGACEQTLEGHGDWVTSVVFSLDGKLVASGSDDDTIKIWDTATGACEQTLKGHGDWVTSVVFAADGKLVASGSHDRTIKIWDTATGACEQTLKGHGHWVTSVVFSADGKLVASGSDDETIKIWDTATGACEQTLKGHDDSVTSVVFSADGKLVASSSYDSTIKLWDTATGACEQTLKDHGGSIRSVVFSLDGKLVASGSDDDTIKIWDTATGACEQTLKGHGHWVTSVVFSADGKLVASGSDDETIKIWDTATGACEQTLKGHGDSVRSVVFSADGKLVASSSYDETIKIWDITTGVCIETIETPRPVSSISFSSSGNQLNTNWGTFDLRSLGENENDNMEVQSSSFFVDKEWIWRDGERLLWLPPDYRPWTLAVKDETLAIGCRSGRVLLIKFLGHGNDA